MIQNRRGLLILLFITLFPFILSCSVDPNESANKLFVESVQIIQNELKNSDNYSNGYKSYKKAKLKIDRILSKFSSSDIAMHLMSGQAKISGLTPREFQDLNNTLDILSEAERNPFTCVLLIAREIEVNSPEPWTLRFIAFEYAEAGKFSQALEIAKIISDETSKDNLLADIAEQYAEAGKLAEALEITKQVEDKAEKARLLAKIAGKYASHEQLTDALEIAKTIEDHPWNKPWKARSLAEIAGNYSKIGKTDIANQLLSQALEEFNKITHDAWKISTLMEIAFSYAKIGQTEKAAQLLSRSLEIAKSINSETEKIEIFTEISGEYAQAGQTDVANQLLAQASAMAQTLKHDFLRNPLLADIAKKYAEAGNLTKALEITKTIEAPRKVWSLVNIATKYTEDEQLAQILETVETINNESEKAWLLGIIAGQYAKAREPNIANQLLSQALAMTKDESAKAELLIAIADKYAEKNQTDTNQLLSQAFDIIKTIPDKPSKDDFLIKIASKYDVVGNHPGENDAFLTEIVQTFKPANSIWAIFN